MPTHILARSRKEDLPCRIRPTFTSQLDGYGKRKHPTKYMVKLPGSNRWRRVYCCCFSNYGTCYVEAAGGWHVIE